MARVKEDTWLAVVYRHGPKKFWVHAQSVRGGNWEFQFRHIKNVPIDVDSVYLSKFPALNSAFESVFDPSRRELMQQQQQQAELQAQQQQQQQQPQQQSQQQQQQRKQNPPKPQSKKHQKVAPKQSQQRTPRQAPPPYFPALSDMNRVTGLSLVPRPAQPAQPAAKPAAVHSADDSVAQPVPLAQPEESAANLVSIFSADDSDGEEEVNGNKHDLGFELRYAHPAEASGFYRAAAAVPAAAPLLGQHLRDWVRQPDAQVPPTALEGLAKTTHKEHLRYMLLVAHRMRQPEAPLAEAIIDTLERLRTDRSWRWSSTLKAAAMIHGALRVLPLYFEDTLPVNLNCYPVWVQAMRSFGLKTKEEKPNQPKPATWEQVRVAVEKASTPELAAAITIAWLTAARMGCVLQLENSDVKIAGNEVSVTFYRGKGVRSRGPYTVHTAASNEQLAIIKPLLTARAKRLFPARLKGEHVKKALRVADPRLEQRSLRRGALQRLAATGLDLDTLMRFSGHTQVKTLQRYLNWGLEDAKGRGTMVGAAKVALTGDPPTSAVVRQC